MNGLAQRNKWLIFSAFFLVFLLLAAGLVWKQTPLSEATVTRAGNTGNSSGNTPAAVQDSGEHRERGADAEGEQLVDFLARQPAALPPSLEGTGVDGGVRVDAGGRLVLEPAVRDLFEYYLSTLGEATLEDVKVWVAHYLNDHLPPEAARQGWALFGRYLDYRRQLADIPDPGLGADAENMKAAIRARARLRREVLGRQAAEAFFALDEAYDDYMMTRLTLREDDTLTEEQRARRLEQARAELPEPLQQIREETTKPVRAREKVEQMRASGASEAEVRAWREAELGAAAADRLEALEARRRQWRQRYEAYWREKQQMQLDGLAEQDREAAVQRLREKHFQAEEIRRAEALDRIRQEAAKTRPDA